MEPDRGRGHRPVAGVPGGGRSGSGPPRRPRATEPWIAETVCENVM